MMIKLLEKIDKTDTCWIWTGHLNKDGYGACKYKKKYWLVHRFTYELFVGPIPKGLVIDHLCKVRNCVNPDHLEAVTIAENNARSDSPSAKHKRQTECKNGHELSGDNLYEWNGWRACKTCRKVAREKNKNRDD